MRAFEFLIEAPLGKEQIKKMDRINRAMQSDPVLIDELFKTISLRVKDEEGKMGDRILSFLTPEGKPRDSDLNYNERFLMSFAAAIEKTEGTTEEKLEFANTLGKVNHIDSKALTTVGLSDWDSWLTGSPFSKRLFLTCFDDPAFQIANKGPGEAALAFLSPNITLQSQGGDIAVGGVPIEVKAGQSSSGGRLSPTAAAVGSLYGNKEFWNSLLPQDPAKALELSKITGVNANNYSEFLSANKLGSDESIKILGAIFLDAGAQGLVTAAGKKGETVTALDIIKIAIKNYGSSQGDENFLILQKDVRKSMFFNVDKVEDVYSKLSVKCPLIDKDARSAGKPQLGILKRGR